MKQLPALLCLLSSCLLAVLQAAEWKIATGANAPIAEQAAARELQAELKALFGKELPIVKGDAASPAIRLGATPENAKLLNVDFNTLKHDEIILKTVGEDLVLAGAPPRGTFYAVYEYLERYLGVRFWAPDDTYYPPRQAFALPKADYRYAPVVRFREAFYDILPRNPSFAVKMRNNWHYARLKEEWGGHDEVLGWCHTMGRLVTEKKYFKDHPEYFALVNGKRTPHTQLCLTNQDCRKALIAEALEWLKTAPNATVISISQNDNQQYCRCPECEAFVKANGNQTDLLLDVVNDVADAIKAVHPSVGVSTLAYQYTRALPKTIRPHDNVIIHLCSIECDFSDAINAGFNTAFGEEVTGWSNLAKQLFIWNYVTNFNAFQFPHPNWKHLASDLRFFVDNKAIGIFEQGSAGPCYAGDLTTLRVYLISKLLWDPTLDQKAIMDEYINGYYGPCAPFIQRYIQLCLEQIEKHHPHPRGLMCFRDDVNWMDDQALDEAVKLMNSAVETAKGNPKLELKIARATSSIWFTLLDRSALFRKYFPAINPMEKLDSLIKLWKDAGCYRYREGGGELTKLRARYELTYAPPQEGTRPDFVPEGKKWYAMSLHTYGSLAQIGIWSFKVDDKNATNGKAVMMPTNHIQWATQLNKYPNDTDYTVYLTMRCDPTPKNLNIGTIGLYDLKDKNDHAKTIYSKDVQGDTYKPVKFTELKGGNTGLFYFAPKILANGPNIYFDRFIFVEK